MTINNFCFQFICKKFNSCQSCLYNKNKAEHAGKSTTFLGSIRELSAVAWETITQKSRATGKSRVIAKFSLLGAKAARAINTQ